MYLISFRNGQVTAANFYNEEEKDTQTIGKKTMLCENLYLVIFTIDEVGIDFRSFFIYFFYQILFYYPTVGEGVIL